MFTLNSRIGPMASAPAVSCTRAPKQLLTTRLVPAAGIRAHSWAHVSQQHQQQQQQQATRRYLAAAAAASSDEQELLINVEATNVSSPSSSSSSSSSSGSSRSPLDDAAQAAAGAVEDASDVAAAAVNSAAEGASAAVSDASDVALTLAGDAAAAAGGEAGGAVNDWQHGTWAVHDPRFDGMKVLVVGATGGVGRRCVEALRAKGAACRALVRDGARAANLLPQPVTTANSSTTSTGPEFDIMTGDVYQYATLPRAFEGCDAVVVASAANDKSDPFGPFKIDYQGTLNLIAAAKRAGVKRFVFVTSIGADDPFNPLNLFWGILFWKKRAEEELQRSGLSYTIVRPGGLKSQLRSGEVAGSIVMEGPDSFGFPPLKHSGAILRSQVADVCVEALVCPAAADKVVEVVAESSAPERSLQQLFEGVVV